MKELKRPCVGSDASHLFVRRSLMAIHGGNKLKAFVSFYIARMKLRCWELFAEARLIDWFSTFFPYSYTGILTLLLTSLLSACLQYFNRSSKSKALYENKTIPVKSAGIASLSAPRHYHCKKIEYSCLLVNLIWFRSYRTQVSLGYGGGPARYSRKRSSIFWMFLKASLPR